jgi:GNAT superfamily N-acetyltransferase
LLLRAVLRSHLASIWSPVMSKTLSLAGHSSKGLTSDHPNLGIGVTDHMQGQGVGRALLRQTLETAARIGLEAVYLMVVQDNLRAIKWYERCGFATYAEEFDEQDQLPYFHMVARTRRD